MASATSLVLPFQTIVPSAAYIHDTLRYAICLSHPLSESVRNSSTKMSFDEGRETLDTAAAPHSANSPDGEYSTPSKPQPQPPNITGPVDSETRERVQHVLHSDIGVSTLLNRLKQSISSSRDFAGFLKERSQIEEKHAQSLKRLSRGTHEIIRRPESKGGSFASNFEEITKIHDRMSDNGLQFSNNLYQMNEELQELTAKCERDRKHWKQVGLDSEKKVQDAESTMNKAKSKYNTLAEQYDRTRTGERQSGKFGIKGTKSAAQQEEDLHRKLDTADNDYSSKVTSTQTARQDLLRTHRPQAVRALEEAIKECDAGLAMQISKYAALNERLLLGNGLCVSPLKSAGTGGFGKSLRDTAQGVDSQKDFHDYVLSFQAKAGQPHPEIRYEKHPALSPKQQQQSQPPPPSFDQSQAQMGTPERNATGLNQYPPSRQTTETGQISGVMPYQPTGGPHQRFPSGPQQSFGQDSLSSNDNVNSQRAPQLPQIGLSGPGQNDSLYSPVKSPMDSRGPGQTMTDGRPSDSFGTGGLDAARPSTQEGPSGRGQFSQPNPSHGLDNRGLSSGQSGYGSDTRGPSTGRPGYSDDSRGPSMSQPGHGSDSRGPSTGRPGYSDDNRGPSMSQPGYGSDSRGPSMGPSIYASDSRGPSTSQPGYGVDNRGPSMGQPGLSSDSRGPSVGQPGYGADNRGQSMGQSGSEAGSRGPSLGQSTDFGGPPRTGPQGQASQSQSSAPQQGSYRGMAGAGSAAAPAAAAAAMSSGASSLPSAQRNKGAQARSNNLPPLRPVFGVSLDELFRRDGSAVPTIVYQCVQAVDLFGLNTEGIYRTSGSAPVIHELKTLFDHGKLFLDYTRSPILILNADSSQVDLRNPTSFHHDIASVTTLLKHFLRDLPDPILTSAAYGQCIQAAKIEEEHVRRDSLHAIINALPDSNYATLRVLTLHLHRVSQHSEKNRMTPSNLGICFGPTLMGPASESGSANGGGPQNDIKDAGWQARVVETLVNNTFQIFDDDE